MSHDRYVSDYDQLMNKHQRRARAAAVASGFALGLIGFGEQAANASPARHAVESVSNHEKNLSPAELVKLYDQKLIDLAKQMKTTPGILITQHNTKPTSTWYWLSVPAKNKHGQNAYNGMNVLLAKGYNVPVMSGVVLGQPHYDSSLGDKYDAGYAVDLRQPNHSISSLSFDPNIFNVYVQNQEIGYQIDADSKTPFSITKGANTAPASAAQVTKGLDQYFAVAESIIKSAKKH